MRTRTATFAVLLALIGTAVGLRAAGPTAGIGPGDVTPPSLAGVFEVSGPITPISDVLLIFDDALLSASIPSGADLADIDVEVGGVRDSVTSAQLTYVGFAFAGEIASFVTAQLATPLIDGTGVTVAYTPHGNPIRDLAGNAALATSPQALGWASVTSFGVMLGVVDGTYGANHLGLILPDAAALPLPDPSTFEVTRNSDPPVVATRVSVFPGFGGRILDVELPICLQDGDTVSATYTRPALNPLRNAAAQQAPTATDITVYAALQPGDSSCGVVAAGGNVTTDPGSGPSPDNPVTSTVTVPSAATVSIAAVTTEQLPTADFNFLSDAVTISVVAPPGTFSAASPIVLEFNVDASEMAAAGVTEQTLQIFRNGSLVGECPGAATANPDPCVTSRTRVPLIGPVQYATFRVLTSEASKWTFAAPVPFAYRAPVDAPPVVNVVNAGKAIPVRFSLGGDRGLNIFAAGYPRSQVVSCAGGAPTDVIEQTLTAGSSSLSYDPGSQTYTYVWKTDRTWSKAPAGPCRQLQLKFNGGSQKVAQFRFT